MTEDKSYRIVSAVVDKNAAIFYCENGEVLTIKQGDYRLNKILDQVIPITTRGEVAVVSFDNLSVYGEFQKRTGGFAKFFKVAKNKISSLFTSIDEDESNKATVIVLPPESSKVEAVSDTSYAPIQKKAEPVNSSPSVQTPTSLRNTGRSQEKKKFDSDARVSTPIPVHAIGDENLKSIDNDDYVADNETVVAIIDGIVIPNIEKLKPYIANALKHSSEEGVKNFLIRISKVIEKRTHSVIDLLRFMEHGDLPIADDGSIIAYKSLKNGPTKGVFVDGRTSNVLQKVGSYVCINEDLVDPNKYNECSNGLHIAIRSYLRSFGGDVFTLVKLAPEDVMTVPHADATKIRAMGYHILGVLSNEAKRLVSENKPFTHLKEDAALLASAINGTHVPRLEEVRIRAQYGGDLVITPLVPSNDVNEEKLSHTEVKSVVAKALDDPSNMPEAVSPKTVNQQVNKEIEAKNEEPKSVSTPRRTSKAKSASKKPIAAPEKPVETKKPEPKATKPTPKKAAPKASKKVSEQVSNVIAEAKQPDKLTPVQEQVLRMFKNGKTKTEIADETGVSRSTLSGWIKKYS